MNKKNEWSDLSCRERFDILVQCGMSETEATEINSARFSDLPVEIRDSLEDQFK